MRTNRNHRGMLTRTGMMRAGWMGAIALAAGLALPFDASAETIRILRKSGKVATASEIVKDEVSEFTYKQPGNSRTQKLEATDIARVIWEGADELYTTGIELLEAGEYDNAINSLEAMFAKTSDPLFKPYVTIALIEANVMEGTSDKQSSANGKAVQLAERFLQESPKSRLTANARLLLGRAQMQSGDHDSAEQTLKDLENEARSKYGQDWEIRAKHWGARNLEAKGTFAEAKNLYESLEKTANKAAGLAEDGSLLQNELRSLEHIGKIRQGICLIESNSIDDAERYYSQMKREGTRNKDPRVLAGAHNGLGIVAFRQGDIRKARFQFLQVSVKYFHDPEETLTALYWIGECYAKLDGEEPGARVRALEYFREVVERNKASRLNSPLAAKAKQKI